MIPSNNQLKLIYTNFQRKLDEAEMGESTCLVCDRLIQNIKIQNFNIEDLPLFNMKLRLRPHIQLPRDLVSQYSLGFLDYRLNNMLLSIGGFISDTHMVNVCISCLNSLKNDDCSNPPKYAIANGFAIGVLPEHLYDSTWPEFAMVKTMSVIATTTILRGGKNRAMKSHAMVFDAGESPIACSLPRLLNDTDIYKVIFAGSLTNEQQILARNRLIVRHKQVIILQILYTI